MPYKQSPDQVQNLDPFLNKNYAGTAEASDTFQKLFFDEDLVSLTNVNRVILNSGVIR